MTQKRDAGRHHGIRHFTPRRHSQPAIVQPCAFIGFSPEHFVLADVKHHARMHLAITLQPDRDRPVGHAVQKIGGAVQRINDEAVCPVAAFDHTALFHEEAIAGTFF